MLKQPTYKRTRKELQTRLNELESTIKDSYEENAALHREIRALRAAVNAYSKLIDSIHTGTRRADIV